jgi:hypothetical protein
VNVEKIEELQEQAFALAVALEALCLEAKAEGAGERVRKRIEQSLAREDTEVPQEFLQEKIQLGQPGDAEDSQEEEEGRYKRNIPPLQGYVPLRDACEKLGINPATIRTWRDYGHIEMAKHPGLNYNYILASDMAFIGRSIESKPDHYTKAGWVANRLRARSRERKKGEGK